MMARATANVGDTPAVVRALPGTARETVNQSADRKGLIVANTPPVMVRVAPALISEARDRTGLPARTSASEVIRYALALAAGVPDPAAAAAMRAGPKPRGGGA